MHFALLRTYRAFVPVDVNTLRIKPFKNCRKLNILFEEKGRVASRGPLSIGFRFGSRRVAYDAIQKDFVLNFKVKRLILHWLFFYKSSPISLALISTGFYTLFFSYSVHIKIMQKYVENYGIKIVKKLQAYVLQPLYLSAFVFVFRIHHVLLHDVGVFLVKRHVLRYMADIRVRRYY